MESAMVRGSQRFDDGVLRRRLVIGLKFFLQHCLRVGRGRRYRISVTQLFAKRTVNEAARCGQAAINEDRAHHGFENIGEQSSLAPAAALLFATSEAYEIA